VVFSTGANARVDRAVSDLGAQAAAALLSVRVLLGSSLRGFLGLRAHLGRLLRLEVFSNLTEIHAQSLGGIQKLRGFPSIVLIGANLIDERTVNDKASKVGFRELGDLRLASLSSRARYSRARACE